MATYSRLPIIEKGTVSIKGERKNNVCIYSNIVTKTDTIRVYNIHLASNWFSQTDYSFMQNPTLETEELKKNVLSIGERLKTPLLKEPNRYMPLKHTSINRLIQ